VKEADVPIGKSVSTLELNPLDPVTVPLNEKETGAATANGDSNANAAASAKPENDTERFIVMLLFTALNFV
jgi:hypothetical protein